MHESGEPLASAQRIAARRPLPHLTQPGKEDLTPTFGAAEKRAAHDRLLKRSESA